MCLKSLIITIVTVGLVGGWCQQPAAAAIRPPASDNLLFRAHFAGTSALMANTNADYLTNFSGLPETAALGTKLVARVASLPARFFTIAGTNSHGELLEPVFADLLRGGFLLELRGDIGAVTEFALAAKSDSETVKRWETAWNEAAANWAAAKKQLAIKRSGEWLFVAGSKSSPAAALATIQKSMAGSRLVAGEVLQGEMASRLLPGPIQRSTYGAFERLKFSVTAENQSFKVRGVASYAADLPRLGPLPVVPTNLITDLPISFTMVREPGSWLEPKSGLRRFLPDPLPEIAFFWGGQASANQLFMAIPFGNREVFNTNFGPTLRDRLVSLAKAIENVTVSLDTNQSIIQMHTVPFVAPKVAVKQSGTNDYLLAETFPASDTAAGLTPALLERVTGRTNLLLYDWEYTQLRFDTWFRIGQLTLMLSRHQQHIGGTPSLKFIQKVQLKTSLAINTSTEITQTGPRELTLNRRAPLAFTSLELFWLANWLESSNFPAANFLMPLPPEDTTETPPPHGP